MPLVREIRLDGYVVRLWSCGIPETNSNYWELVILKTSEDGLLLLDHRVFNLGFPSDYEEDSNTLIRWFHSIDFQTLLKQINWPV